MISAVDLLKGIAAGAEMDCRIVEGANGGLHTNYEGKARAAVKALTEEGYDLRIFMWKRRMKWGIREALNARSNP